MAYRVEEPAGLRLDVDDPVPDATLTAAPEDRDVRVTLFVIGAEPLAVVIDYERALALASDLIAAAREVMP